MNRYFAAAVVVAITVLSGCKGSDAVMPAEEAHAKDVEQWKHRKRFTDGMPPPDLLAPKKPKETRQ